MKHTLVITLLFLMGFKNAKSQTPAMQVADRIAQKMKDSLNLSAQQKEQLYAVNIGLSNAQALVWQQHSNLDSIGFYIQRIEMFRDSLYRPILPEQKYLLYRAKKANLISNN